MNEKEFADLAAGAALDALSPDDAERYHAALVAHPEWQGIVDADADSATFLALGAAPMAPAPELRAALLARIAVTPQTGDITDLGVTSTPAAVDPDEHRAEPIVTETAAGATAPKAPAHPLRVLFALAACLALLVGVGVGAVALNDYVNRPASVVALQEIQSAEDAQEASIELADGGTATAHWSASLGTAVLVADGIETLPEDRAYELWFVRGETPISAGVFEADGGDATAVLAGEMHEGDIIAVTVEQAGGSPSGLPTTDPVIAIPTA
ncbi:anti-sigma factor [Microbacterium sp. UFMG61]|uniref:anti-sigma factor n=1 Tax=Microbacterium sp. UFMG61 TaxID=2745935 RepID=UPI00189054A3|nr:anti-sigma factor [Microbacterium sp. UFMG61]